MKKETAAETVQFVWDFERVLQEDDGSDQTEYLAADEQYGTLLGTYDGTSSSYYEPDALGSGSATDTCLSGKSIVRNWARGDMMDSSLIMVPSHGIDSAPAVRTPAVVALGFRLRGPVEFARSDFPIRSVGLFRRTPVN